MTIARGGKAVYGASIGILMLETRFPRIHGDGGNAATWPFPMLFKVVPAATPDRVVRQGATGLLDVFIAAARDLVDQGADGITTNCGFLALYQKDLAAACEVPVATSSMMQVPWVQSLLPPGRRVGIVTISRDSLTPAHLEAAGAPPDTPVEGTDSGREFCRALLNDELSLDVELAREDVIEAAKRLTANNPEVSAIVLECTNMPPYAASIANVLGLPVYDFYSFINWFHSGISPRRFS